MAQPGRALLLKLHEPLKRRKAVVIMGGSVLLGGALLVAIFAAGVASFFEPENGTLTGGATIVVNAGASGGKAIRFGVAATPTPTPIGLPAGVTLSQIDGGPNYYCSNGFTYACNAGWDNASFFPLGVYYGMFHSQADVARWKDLSMNTSVQVTADSDMTLLRNNGIWDVVSSNGSGPENPVGTETVGLNAYDEPSTMSQWTAGLSNTTNAVQDHRFWMLNNTWNFIAYGGISPVGSSQQVLATKVATPNGTQRSVNVPSVDIYWFAGLAAGWNTQCALLYGLPSNCTNDQVARGSNFGLMVDEMRNFVTPPGGEPIMQFVEDGGPYTQDTTASSYITPPQLNWGVWSSIIHGARMIIYFNHSFAGPAISDDNFAQPYYQAVQPGQSISIYNQAKATNGLVAQLASVINSPNAAGYSSVSPAATGIFNGIETMTKYSGGRFYIFADTRESQTRTNIGATFTIKNTGATSVTVVGENRTLPVTNGTTFADTFANGASVHIYQVN